MNLMAKVKLIFYGVLVFSIYLIAIFYSFGDHETSIIQTSTSKVADLSNVNDQRKNVHIKFILLDSSGHPRNETVIMIEKKHIKEQEKEEPLKVETNYKGEFELNIKSGSYLMYEETKPLDQKQVNIRSKDDGKTRELKF